MKEYVVVLYADERRLGEEEANQETYIYELVAQDYQDAMDVAYELWSEANGERWILLSCTYTVIEGKVVHS